MTSLQTTCSEFLRQFWSAVHPPPPEQGVLSVATPEQLLAREDKMVNHLLKIQDRIDEILRSGEAVGVDPNRIQDAFEHTTAAVKKALTTHRNRTRR